MRLQKHLEAMSANTENLECVQIQHTLKRPSSICAVSKDLLLCTDDEQGVVNQIALSFNGATIHGASCFPIQSTLNINSICVLGTCTYISASSTNGGLYRCNLSTQEVEQVYINSEASDVNIICAFKN